MKKLALILATLLMTVSYATAQEEDNNDAEDAVYTPEKGPEFPGGTDALFKFLSSNLKYPSDAKKEGVQGRVICQFTVNKDGSISDIQVLRSVYPSLDREAVRVISIMPKWEPGEQRGKKVKCKFTMPIVFKLSTPNRKSQAPKGINYRPNHKDIYGKPLL
ncbi:MAG: energy transducer TonB [Paludibacteraceae bacterium]|nr:energy transducer TonB [Paludibacteraceae bacterium]